MKKNCLYCGKEFETSKYTPSSQKFCSIKCYNKYNWKHKNKRSDITKKCLECGKEFVIESGKSSIQKYCSVSCRQKFVDNRLGKEHIKNRYNGWYYKAMNNQDSHNRLLLSTRKYANSKKGRYSNISTGAKKRNIYFNLTFEEFLTFWDKPCHYCGDKINGAGIDRVDNSVGYEISNCVSCCGTCNLMKRSMTVSDFFSHIQKIINHTAQVRPLDSSPS